MYNGLHRTLKFDKSHPHFFEAKIIIFMEGYYFSSTDPRTIRIATHAAKMFSCLRSRVRCGAQETLISIR